MDKMKMIEELRDKIDTIDKENFFLRKSFEDKEKFYLEKIKFLETQLQNSSKNDIILLQKQNKEYEDQVIVLNKRITMMNKSHDVEKEKFNSVVAEVMVLKNKLAEDINNIEQLRGDLLSQQEAMEKQVGKDDKDKISIVLKYDNDRKSVENEANNSQVKSITYNNSNIGLQNSKLTNNNRSNISMKQSNKELKNNEDSILLRRNTTDKEKNI
jgi:hypothetical protein